MSTNDLLTTEEMSALLKKADPGGDKRRVAPYNFRRPDRLSKEQMRSLYLLHDTLSHALSSSLPVFLRTVSEVALISVEQQACADYIKGITDPTALFTLSLYPLPGVAALEISPLLAFPIVDWMLGGPGAPGQEPRAVTEIEQNILEGFLQPVLEELREAWRPLIDIDPSVVGRETRPQMLQIVAPNEVVLSVTFQVQIGEARGPLCLGIPATMLEPILSKFNRTAFARRREIPPEDTRALLDALAGVSFPVTAELESTTFTLNEIMNLAPGDVLRLDHRLEQPVRINISGMQKFNGELGEQQKRAVVSLQPA